MLRRFVSLIMRFLRKDSALTEATVNQTRLGVLGLPVDVGPCGAGLASVLLVRDEALGQRCVLSSARNFRQAGPLAILASGESGQKFMDQFARSLDSPDEFSREALVFFRITDDCAETMGRLGANRFFDEIDACGVTEQFAVLVQGGPGDLRLAEPRPIYQTVACLEGLDCKSSGFHSPDNRGY